MTVRGPIEEAQLGVTLPHEHVFLNLCRVFPPHRDLILNDTELAVMELERFREAGGSTIVELSTPDLGRDPKSLLEVSERTGINIVMGTGRYREPFYEPSMWTRPTRDLGNELVREIEVGVDGVRPGIIGEIGTHLDYVSPVEERVHRAAVFAAEQTGLTITTHSHASPVGLAQLDLFVEAGADPRRVVIGHCDTFPFIDYHRALARRGAWVQFDAIRGTIDYETRRTTALIVALIAEGYINQILLSQDVCSDRHLSEFGGTGYAYLLNEFRGRLRDAGLSEEQLHVLFLENPRRMLTGQTR